MPIFAARYFSWECTAQTTFCMLLNSDVGPQSPHPDRCLNDTMEGHSIVRRITSYHLRDSPFFQYQPGR